jgi:hypothetical protein
VLAPIPWRQRCRPHHDEGLRALRTAPGVSKVVHLLPPGTAVLRRPCWEFDSDFLLIRGLDGDDSVKSGVARLVAPAMLTS